MKCLKKTKPNDKPRELKNVVYQRLEKNFKERDSDVQDWITENNYCGKCKKADTGLDYPIEYKFNGKIYVDGICKVCATSCSTEMKIETE